MDKLTHDPSEHIRGLQQLLISDKKKIGFLFGAGTSSAKKNNDSFFIPTTYKITQEVEEELYKKKKYKNAIEEIKIEIGESKYNIETLLSKIEQKQHVIGKSMLNGLLESEFKELIQEVKKQIKGKVSIHETISANKKCLENLIHVDFAEWIARADRKYPIEIFTTNYDYLFEIGMESKNVSYYDGFTGSYVPFFYSESVEDLSFLPRQTKLWKIHGSLGWRFDEDSKKVIRKDTDNDDILIYPSTLKYSDSKKQPYISLMDRLSNFLKQDDTLLITCGYSFGDEHINERILTALGTNISSHVIALFYDIVWSENTKKYSMDEKFSLIKMAQSNSKLSVYGCRSAVIGCQHGNWRLKTEPDKNDSLNVNLYFDEDAHIGNDEKNVEKKGEEIWTGEGELILPDFLRFVTFLKSMIIDHKMYQTR